MANAQTQVRIDPIVKRNANELFKTLGLDMSTAINIFLNQCILTGGLPFEVKVPSYKKEVLEAMEEAKRISRDPNVKGYSSIEELKKALDEE